jgi:hypothetical protein
VRTINHKGETKINYCISPSQGYRKNTYRGSKLQVHRGAMSYRFHIRLEKQDKIQLLNRKHIDEFEGTLVAQRNISHHESKKYAKLHIINGVTNINVDLTD